MTKMPKIPQEPLDATHLSTYLVESSDFGFEMSALRILRLAGFDAVHAGTYVDPVTGKIRAYDVRAQWSEDQRTLRLAVECKNLRANAPLLVHATPRLDDESYHSLVKQTSSAGWQFNSAERIGKGSSVYEADGPVGRQFDQPMRDDQGGFRSSDSATYEKWLQAVNGCVDLLRDAVRAPTQYPSMTSIIPILVVPANMLWQVDYDVNGATATPLHRVDKTTLILRHVWSTPTALGQLNYDISHLEVVTLPALGARLDELRGDHGLFIHADKLLER